MKMKQILLTIFYAGLMLFSGKASADTWPPVPYADRGMVWYWANQTEGGFLETSSGDWVRDCEVRFRYGARPNWYTGVDLREGGLEAYDVGEVLGRQVLATQKLILEMGLSPGDGRRDGVLFQWGNPETTWVRVWVEDGRLWMVSADGDPLALGAFALKDPTYLAIEIEADRINWSKNGIAQPQQMWGGMALPTTEGGFDGAIVIFGSDFTGNESWRGDMDHIAIRVQPGDVSDAVGVWKQSLEVRNPPSVFQKDVVLVEASGLPDPEDLMDYDESIMALIWEVVGEEDDLKGERILTWHWYQLDRDILKHAAPPPLGTPAKLQLSPAESQPQIQGVQMIHIGLDPDDFILYPEYFILQGWED